MSIHLAMIRLYFIKEEYDGLYKGILYKGRPTSNGWVFKHNSIEFSFNEGDRK